MTTVTHRSPVTAARTPAVKTPAKPAVHHPHQPTKPTDSFGGASTFNPFDPFGIAKAWGDMAVLSTMGGNVLGYPTTAPLGY